MAKLSGDLIRYKLRTHVIGQSVLFTEQTGSTNSELKRLARLGAPEGLLYITEEQLVGRGRLERSWVAPPQSSLLMSLLFRPGDYLPAGRLQALTMLSSLAMLDAVESECDLRLHLKWPNDIVAADGKKVAGILTEAEFDGDRVNWAVVGLGMNVNIDFGDQTEAAPDRPGKPASGHRPLAETASSLSMLLERDTADLRLPLLQTFLHNVEKRFVALQKGVWPHYEWQRRLLDLNRSVSVKALDQGQLYEGQIVGVTESGALRLRQADDTIITIAVGDVTLR